MKTRKIVYLLSLAAILIGSAACHKSSSTTNTGVPNVAVSFNIDVNSPQFVNLTVPGGYYIVTGGYLEHGIIIYRATQDQFYAMDCTCTYNNNGYVRIEKNGIFAIDSTCGSVFVISDGGSVSHGPASLPLKNYQTSFDGNTLIVTN